MAAYRRVYGFSHLRADCRGPGSAPEPYIHFNYGTCSEKERCLLFTTTTTATATTTTTTDPLATVRLHQRGLSSQSLGK